MQLHTLYKVCANSICSLNNGGFHEHTANDASVCIFQPYWSGRLAHHCTSGISETATVACSLEIFTDGDNTQQTDLQQFWTVVKVVSPYKLKLNIV